MQPATFDLQITWKKGDSPSRIYVAAVPEDQPWAKPTRETVLEDASSLSWSLPPGNYRLIAGAPDFLTVYSPTIDLAPRQRHHETIELQRFVYLTGRVVDQEGSPLRGARVGRLRAFVDHFSKRLSPLGEETLADNFLRETADDGRFTFPVHPSAGQFLWVEADRHTPRILRNVRWAGPGSSLGTIALSPGGALDVHWTRPSDPASDDLRLQLVPGKDVELGSLTDEDARAVWGRSVTPGSASWSSLPPGTYDLFVKGPPYAAHRLVPQRVARFDVTPGETTSRTVELPAVGSPGSNPPERAGGRAKLKDVSLFLPEVHLAQLDGLTVVRWPEDHGAESTSAAARVTRAEDASAGSRVDLTRSCSAGSAFLVFSAGFVGVSKPVAAHGCAQPIRISLSPRSTLEARFLAPQGEQLPGWAKILFRPCGPESQAADSATGGEPTMVIPAELTPQGKLSTPAPAGCFETAASVSRFAVTEWTTVKLPKDGVGKLPLMHLLPGGAILARVVSGRDGLGLEGIRVRAVEDDELAALYRAAVRAGAPPSTEVASPLVGSTSSDGWVRLYGLRPGTWRLALTSEGHQYPAVSNPIGIRGPEEVVVDPLELPPPAGVTVRVEMGSSFAETGAKPENVFAHGADSSSPLFHLQLAAPLDATGTARLRDLPPGRWTISGLVRLESGRLVAAGKVALDVPPGQDIFATLVLDEPLFGGEVTYRGKPVEGDLVLTPIPLDGRRKMTVRLDDDGHFTVPLERDGSYRAEVTSRDGHILRALVPEVDFDDPGEKVEIALPTSRIAGFVLAPDGDPAPKASVEARSVPQGSGVTSQNTPPRDLQRRARTDEDGAFAFEGLSPARWTLRATREDLVSDRQEIDLGQNEERSGLLLDLGSPSRVELLVTSQSGLPQPGVQILVTVPPSSPGGTPEAHRGVSDEQGLVAIELPERPDLPVNLMLKSPSGLVTAKRVVLRDGASVDLGNAASELRIHVPQQEGAPSGWVFLITESGAYLNPHWAGVRFNPADGEAGWLVVPRLSNEPWTVVTPSSADELFLVTTGRGLDLPVAATVTLDGTIRTVDLGED